MVLLRGVNFKTEFKFVFSSSLNAESRNAIMKHESENFEIKKIQNTSRRIRLKEKKFERIAIGP